MRHLHLGTPWIQGSMRMKAPFDIELEYVQRMMAWLLFLPLETWPDDRVAHHLSELHAVQLGLGAGALTKFHHKKLGTRTTAIELNPQVIHICRHWFRLPADNATLRVVQADAAQEIRRPHWQACVDALQVDLYDHQAAAPVLDSADFYADCRTMLTAGGCMSVNLFGRASSYAHSLDKIRQAFGEAGLWAFRPTREGNTIVLARRAEDIPAADMLRIRADIVQVRWGLPAAKWLKVLRPICD